MKMTKEIQKTHWKAIIGLKHNLIVNIPIQLIALAINL